ncbi:hypothetical protein KZJ38_07150 [Paraburkholderia edwinii]|uniref:HdeA/HdeB family protein n=1 Tax=Paraburkholderia edwinii TaxID=2861782 RepID=A0ABX8UNA9_9BURK|nr:hypothetical protein [Paraburkholderia edwinii]QYD70081.1 hypothetical protein KZJ38_07150 [Paraburkholderia edwinii]
MKYEMNKRFLRQLIFMVLISIISTEALAAKRTFTAIGTRTCTSWLKAGSEKGSGKDNLGIAWLSDQSWMAGYLTGINQITTNSRDLLVGLDLETISDWTTQFCQSNADADVPDAIAALFKKLKRQP